MTVKLAFCSDCDLQTFEGYRAVHRAFAEAGLHAGDSFWLFDPSGGEMALFRGNCSQRGPFHDELLEEIRQGRMDVLHSVGSFSDRFNLGYRPERKVIAEALDYLGKHARIPRIWSNHGDDRNIQNIGGGKPHYYHHGDELGSDCYILDLLLDHGFEYFWIDNHLSRHADRPARLVAPERARSGQTIKVFHRFMGDLAWAPNGQNLAMQLTEANLDKWAAIGQNVVLYQHWGCHHDDKRWAYSPEGDPLTAESHDAIRWLGEQQSKGRIQVVPLGALLDEEAAKPAMAEIDRVARVVVRGLDSPDGHHRYQVEKHTLPYFQERLNYLDPRGTRLLDAGCGIGQWSLCATDRFHVVEGFDSDSDAIVIAQQIADAARVPVAYSVRDIYATGYADRTFDFIICYGVIFLVAALGALRELFRITTYGGQVFLSVNGDSWYCHLVDERFLDAGDETRQLYVLPVWNAYVARCGGAGRLKPLAMSAYSQIESASRSSAAEQASMLKRFLVSRTAEEVGKVIDTYSPYMLRGLLDRLEALGRPAPAPTRLGLLAWFTRRTEIVEPAESPAEDALENLPLYNRPYLPSEFEAVAMAAGFTDFRWKADGSLSADPKRAMQPPRAVNPHAWECLLRRPW